MTARTEGLMRPCLAAKGFAVGWPLLAALLLGGTPKPASAAPPELTTVRVPSERVQGWFPPGTELTVLPPDKFEALVRAARAGWSRREALQPPRLLSARHSARWDDGLLVGRSELKFAPTRSGHSEVALEPWTPAIVQGPDGRSPVLADDKGHLSIRVPATVGNKGEPETVELAWQLRARPGSRGWKFNLGLPVADVSELTLDLPEGWEPGGAAGLRVGPKPTGRAGRWSWTFLGPSGVSELKLVRPDGKDDGPDAPSLWCSGPTRIEVGESAAVWTLEWAVSAGPWAPQQLSLDLGPGLELVSVTGPAVEEYRSEPSSATIAKNAAGRPTRVSVRLRSDQPAGAAASPSTTALATTSITVRAMARVPSEGRWVIPSARPVNAVWTGGTTTVRLAPSRVIRGIRTLSGRRAATKAGGSAEDRTLVFDAERPEPVAEIDLRKPWTDATATVNGRLHVTPGTSPRLDCRMTWKVDRGRLLDLDFELPRDWSAERVEVEGVNEPLSWHAESRSDSGVLIRVAAPAGDWSERSPVLRVSATADATIGTEAIALPRVRPVGARVSDEVWIARGEPGLTLRPARARGIAWIDPAVAEVGSGTGQGAQAGATTDLLRPALAWRWVVEDAECLVELERDALPPVGATEMVATVSAERLRVDARLTLTIEDKPLRRIPVGLSESVGDATAWHFTDEASGLELPRRPLDVRERTDAGLPGGGPAWMLEFPSPQHGRVGVIARYEGQWAGAGRLPLIMLRQSYQVRGVVLVLTGRGVRTSVTTRKVRALDADVTSESLAALGLGEAGTGAVREASGLGLRRAHAFSYETREAQIALTVEPLTAEPTDGLIRDAVLTTLVNPGGPTRNRLTLRIVSDRSSSFSFKLSPGSRIERVRRDGQPVTPLRSGTGFTVSLSSGGNGGVGSGSGPVRGIVSLTLDYVGPAVPSDGLVKILADGPRFSLPCLSLAWELVVPEPWQVEGWGPALISADPALDARPSLARRLANYVTSERWFGSRTSRSGSQEGTSLLRDLDARVGGSRTEEVTLGEWFLRWDAGPWPVVIDRPALAAAGWGPRSRIAPTRVEAGAPGAAQASLGPLGLAVVPIDRVLLVTTHDTSRALLEDRKGRSAASGLSRAVAEAAAWGSDESSRFESVARWREHAAPRATLSVEALTADGHGEGRSVRRFVAVGWPEVGVEVRLLDGRVRRASCWAVALAVLTAGLAALRLPRPARAGMAVGFLSLGLLGIVAAPLWFVGIAEGLFVGALVLSSVELGRVLPSLPSVFRRNESRQGSTARRRVGSSLVSPALLALGVAGAGLATPWTLAQVAPDGPIVVLFPYDGQPDPFRRPDRVVMRLADFNRLSETAEEAAKLTPLVPRATSVVHRVSWRDRRSLVVESDFTLVVDRAGPADWSFPVDDARAISATLDGVELPVRVEAGGRQASVRFEADEPAGTTRHLVVQRTLTPSTAEWGAAITASVNPVPTARFEVAPHPDGLRPDVPVARGKLDDGGKADRLAGLLGPAARLEVRWNAPGARGDIQPSGTVEGQYLWDATPAGDRVRARLSYRNPGGTAVVRLALEPGALVRDYSIPGAVDVSWEGTADRPEWVARIDPPLPDGAMIGLDVRRPRTPPKPSDKADEAPAPRTIPLIEPRGVERSTGTLGFRRPPEWVGRLVPANASEPLTEEAFVRAWGRLPDEPLTLSGVIRLPTTPGRATIPGVATGPRQSSWLVQPSELLTLEAGRINVAVDVDLSPTDGTMDEAEAALPAGFKLVGVEADGLTDWTLPTKRTLRIRFDGPAARSRRVRVRGWLPIDPNPAPAAIAVREMDVPWLTWAGSSVSRGTLVVSSTTPVELVGASGATMILSEAQGTRASGGSPTRVTYRVTRTGELGRLRWESPPPRVAVRVDSQLTIDPDSAEWVAVVRYDVSGGPLQAINLKLPNDWARAAVVRLAGTTYQQVSETLDESTYWTIRPDRPVWGSQRLVVRSSAPFPVGSSRVFPDLSPLGRGEVDVHLRVVNATRQTLAVDDSPGVQVVAQAAAATDPELAAQSLRGSTTSYHAVKPGWSLRVRKVDQADRGDPQRPEPRVEHGRVVCNLAADGSVLGLARYDVAARGGPFLGVRLAKGSRPLLASVNGVPAVPLRVETGRWLVPLADVGPSKVVLVWKSAAGHDGTDPSRPLTVPAVGSGNVPSVVTVYGPEGATVASRAARMAPVRFDQGLLEEAGWLRSQMIGSLGGIDTSSRKDGEDLVAALVRFRLLLRQAERAAEGVADTTAEEREVRLSQVRSSTHELLEEVGAALHNAKLDDAEASSRAFLGVDAGLQQASISPTSEPAATVSVRPLGRPYSFVGELPSAMPSPWLVWTRAAEPSEAASPWFWVLISAAVTAPLVVVLATRGGRGLRRGRAALAAVLALAAVVAGPWGLGVGLALAVAGRMFFGRA